MIKEYYHDIDLNSNQLYNSRLHNISTTDRVALGLTLTINSKGFMVYDTDVKLPFFWDGTLWQQAGGTWGNIAGIITNQTDLITYLSTNYTPQSRTITINGTAQNLSANQSWTITAATVGALSSTLLPGNIFVGNGSSVATGVTLTLSGTSGTFSLSSAGVLTIPDASGTTTRGFVGTGAQTFGGIKTFSSAPVLTGMASGGSTQYRLLATNSAASVNITPNLIWDNTVLGLGIGKVPSAGKALDVNGNVAISSLSTVSTGTYKMVVSSGTLGNLSLQDIPSISGESYNGQFYSEAIQTAPGISAMCFEVTDFTNQISVDYTYQYATRYVSVSGNVLTIVNYSNYNGFTESAYVVGPGFESYTLTNAGISGTTLTYVSGSGTIAPKVGDIITGTGVADNTRIVAVDLVNLLITVSISQNVSVTATMYIWGTKLLSRLSGSGGTGSTYLLNNSITPSVTNQLVNLYSFRYIYINATGKYNIQFKAQFKNTDTVDQEVNIWLEKVTTIVPNTTGTISIPAKHGVSNVPGYAVASWGYIVDAVAGDFFLISWNTSNPNTVTLESADQIVGYQSATPSCALRVTVVSGLVSGTALGSINYMSVTATGGTYNIIPDNGGNYITSSTDVDINNGQVSGTPAGSIYLRIPTAGMNGATPSSSIARGLVSNTTQSFFGNKTFANNITITGTSLHTGIATFTAAPVFSSTTASTLLTVGSGKALASFASTGVVKTVLGIPSTMNGTANGLTYWSNSDTLGNLSGNGVLKLSTTAVPSVMNGTANTITYWSDANTIGALALTTYPSLTELSYVKNVTSAIQTQLDGKQPLATNLTSLAGLTYGTSLAFVKMSAAGTFSLDTNTYLTGNQTITLSGDISGSGATSITTSIGNNKVTNAMLAQVATSTFKGRITAGTGIVENLTATEATSLLDLFSSTLKGLTPASGGGTTNFLRADGIWAAPPGGGGSALTIQDEGNTLTAGATLIDFTGPGVTATATGTSVTVTISGGGGGGAGISLPVPKVRLTKGSASIQGLNNGLGTSAGSLTLNRYPIVIAEDISKDILDNYQVFVEMVHYKRKGRRMLAGNAEIQAAGYVVESDLYHDPANPSNILWRMPWPETFWNRNNSPHWTPQRQGIVLVNINRPNWYQVTSVNQSIPVYEYLNSRFYQANVEYRDTSGTLQTLANTFIPVYGSRSAGKNRATSRFAYSPFYTPLYVAFRYIVWNPNGGPIDPDTEAPYGEIISGPLSRVVKIGHEQFPFNYDYAASSIYGVPCASISGLYDATVLRCLFETRVP